MPVVNFESVDIEKDPDTQLIIGHAGFIKTAEDLYEAMATSMPGVKFGIAFAEASGPCLVRSEGNDDALVSAAEKNALAIGAGHTFVILFKGAYPINVIEKVRNVQEVSEIFCATANETQVIVGSTEKGRAVVGVVDGSAAKGIESAEEKEKRRKFLRDIGYKR